VPSARPRHLTRLVLAGVCGLLLIGAASGCTTTQETATRKQAESKRFLEEREKHRAERKAGKGEREKETQ
jgi:hypothetical protein